MEKLLTTTEVAYHLDLTAKAIRRYITDHKLRAVKLGRDYRIDPAALAEFKAACETGDAPPARRSRRTSKDGSPDILAQFGA